MSVAATTPATLAELLERLGRVSLDRILMQPPPGTAAPSDVLASRGLPSKRLCELVDGVLVEKPMGHLESRLAARLVALLTYYLDGHDIGIVAGADAPHRLKPNLVRLPDVSFIRYERIPEDADPATAMPDWAPNLAVEILSPSNTTAEMERKRAEYFAAGVELVWMVYPSTRTVEVYDAVDRFTTLTEDDALDGHGVLPGFQLSIRDWFARATKLRP